MASPTKAERTPVATIKTPAVADALRFLVQAGRITHAEATDVAKIIAEHAITSYRATSRRALREALTPAEAPGEE